jgi:hypothetical protein
MSSNAVGVAIGAIAGVVLWANAAVAGQPSAKAAPVHTPTAVAAEAAGKACGAAGGRALPASGQVTTKTAGDDGSVRAGAPLRYVDNHDGTITDCVTGLMWEKKVKLDHVREPANLHDADNCYAWRGACAMSREAECSVDADCGANGPCVTADCQTAAPNGLTIFKWVAQLNAATFAGYGDWRVPNVKELQSLVDYNIVKPAIAAAFAGNSCSSCSDLADPACSCTQPENYWSSTTLAPANDGAWVVYFANGTVVFNVKTSTFFVRAVRGGM